MVRRKRGDHSFLMVEFVQKLYPGFDPVANFVVRRAPNVKPRDVRAVGMKAVLLRLYQDGHRCCDCMICTHKILSVIAMQHSVASASYQKPTA